MGKGRKLAGFCYVGFRTEKEYKKALNKDKLFIGIVYRYLFVLYAAKVANKCAILMIVKGYHSLWMPRTSDALRAYLPTLPLEPPQKLLPPYSTQGYNTT